MREGRHCYSNRVNIERVANLYQCAQGRHAELQPADALVFERRFGG